MNARKSRERKREHKSSLQDRIAQLQEERKGLGMRLQALGLPSPEVVLRDGVLGLSLQQVLQQAPADPVQAGAVAAVIQEHHEAARAPAPRLPRGVQGVDAQAAAAAEAAASAASTGAATAAAARAGSGGRRAGGRKLQGGAAAGPDDAAGAAALHALARGSADSKASG